MGITGCDLVVLTFTPPREIFARVVASVLARWPDALMDDADGSLSPKSVAAFPRDQLPKGEGFIVFYRDAAMVRHMVQAAYAPMPDGDGPFAIATRPRGGVEFELSGVGERRASERGLGWPPEPYSAWLCSPTVVEVTAITPGEPESLAFAAWVLDETKRACRGAA